MIAVLYSCIGHMLLMMLATRVIGLKSLGHTRNVCSPNAVAEIHHTHAAVRTSSCPEALNSSTVDIEVMKQEYLNFLQSIIMQSTLHVVFAFRSDHPLRKMVYGEETLDGQVVM